MLTCIRKNQLTILTREEPNEKSPPTKKHTLKKRTSQR